MPRRSGVWLHRRRGMFFTTIDGAQVPLHIPGPDTPESRAAAEESLRRLIDERIRLSSAEPRSQTGHGQPQSALTVSQAVSAFLAARERDHARGDLGADTLRGYRTPAADLSAGLGTRPVASLTAADLEEWAFRPGWGRATRRVYLGVALRVLREAGHPLAARRPPAESRGAECVLTDPQFAAVLADLRSRPHAADLPELLEVLRATGARPGEVCGLTVEGVDWEHTLARLVKHKTRRKTGKPRVLHFNTDAMRVLERQRARYGSGLLFRNTQGRAYKPARVADRLAVVSARLGFRVLAYGLGRHSFCSRALAAGVPDAVVAGLMGHTDTKMIHAHYSHISENSRLLKEAAERVSRGRAG